jgi:hypothetical protein
VGLQPRPAQWCRSEAAAGAAEAPQCCCAELAVVLGGADCGAAGALVALMLCCAVCKHWLTEEKSLWGPWVVVFNQRPCW